MRLAGPYVTIRRCLNIFIIGISVSAISVYYKKIRQRNYYSTGQHNKGWTTTGINKDQITLN